ncbi:35492_t:CDS:2, partial [Racocetra persica]
MVAEVVDYRVSRLVVLCKDCGSDVGLYPSRHKCIISDEQNTPSYLSHSSKQSNDNNKINNKEQQSATSLWSKLKTVNNWREIAQDDPVSPTQATPSGKLWDKLLSAASSAYGSLEDNSDNESEKDEWEGETHISRILREYHQQKNGDIPA